MIDLIFNLDIHLVSLIQMYGVWIYAIVFVVIFCETGLVIAPFLPGDSLLFLLGGLAARGLIDMQVIIFITIVAAFLGDAVNYHIGKLLGRKVFHSDTSRIFKKKYLTQTEAFYEKYGAKAIIIARFMPIVRTFAPFVAGVGKMSYRKFLAYNIIGGIAWVLIFVVGGYLFGNIPFIKENLTIMVMVIIVLSVIPALIEYLRNRRQAK
ncbi:DedA family protein [Candidatus Gracilibacteria bacterium]|nr:DedA family protein [Candidatus Gracilibacteria bacterium]